MPTEDFLVPLLADAAAAASCGKALSDDLVPVDLIKAAGLPYIKHVARVARKSMAMRVPFSWRSGVMAAVPKKPRVPMTLATGRGILCSSHTGKLLAKVCRGQLVRSLRAAAGPLQFGAVPKGGVELPGHAVRLFTAASSALKLSRAVLFTDIKPAFYTTMVEAAVGPLLSVEQRVRRLTGLGFTELEVKYIRHLVEEAPDGFTQHGAAGHWVRLARDWHTGANFRVKGGSSWLLPDDGTRPGDPLADVVFCGAFFRFQQHLVMSLEASGLVATLPVAGQHVFDNGEAPEAVGLLPPTFMDDLAVLVQADDAIALCGRVVAAAEATIASAKQFGLRQPWISEWWIAGAVQDYQHPMT